MQETYQRNTAIDFMRALTMVLMITVNHFWTAKGIPHWMHHAAGNEDMLGLSDIVFPLFLFTMGMSIPYAIESKYNHNVAERDILSHILTRGIALLLMGAFICHAESGIDGVSGYSHTTYTLLMLAGFFLIWNKYPDSFSPLIRNLLIFSGILILLFLAITAKNPDGGVFHPHWWGILGLIGWTYLACALIYFFCRKKIWTLTLVLGIFLLYNILSSPIGDVQQWNILLPAGWNHTLSEVTRPLHMGSCGEVSLAMAGIVLSCYTAKWSQHPTIKQTALLLSISICLAIAAILAHRYFIFSKLQETPSWVLAVMSIATALYGVLNYATSNNGLRWLAFIRPAGTATLTCYMVPYLLYSLWTLTHFHLPSWMEQYPVGLLQCLAFSLLCVLITYILGKIHIKLKI